MRSADVENFHFLFYLRVDLCLRIQVIQSIIHDGDSRTQVFDLNGVAFLIATERVDFLTLLSYNLVDLTLA